MADPKSYEDMHEDSCRHIIAQAMLNPFDASNDWRQTVVRDAIGIPINLDYVPATGFAHEVARGVFHYLKTEDSDIADAFDCVVEDDRKRLVAGVAALIQYGINDELRYLETTGVRRSPTYEIKEG